MRLMRLDKPAPATECPTGTAAEESSPPPGLCPSVPNSTAVQAPLVQSPPPGLLQRLEAAAAEGLSANTTRFLRFLGHQDGEVMELQALGVPGKYASTNHFTHARTVAGALAALEQAEQRMAMGVYVLFNAVDPAVSTRAASGAWHVARRGESTTDRDVRGRRALYIDVDAERVSGTSATDEELQHAFARAADILGWLEGRVPAGAIGIGHSGNGASVFLSLASLPERPELALSIKAFLAGLSHRFSDARAKVDRSVCDAKRLCPAFGTTKRKGAPGLAERPHRRTGFVCEESVERLDEAALGALVQALRVELDEDGRALMDRELGVARATPVAPSSRGSAWQLPPTASPFATANAHPIAEVIAWLGLEGDDGRVRCPGCGESDKGVAVVGNGLKCQHDRCAGKGVRAGFRSVVDLVMEARGVDAKQALALLSERFGLPGLRGSGESQRPLGGGAPLGGEVPSAEAVVKQLQPAGGGASPSTKDASAAGTRGKGADGRLRIDLTSLEEYEVNELVSRELRQLDNVYHRMGRLVEVHEASVRKAGEMESDTQLEIRDLSEAVLRDFITRVCAFETKRPGGKTGEPVTVKAPPPTWCIRAVAQRGRWPSVRQLQQVTEVPLLLPDGSLVETPGYDSVTASLYRPSFELPKVAEHPTQEEVRAAADQLLELVCDFPFVEPVHRSAWLAALLTPIARWAFRGQSPLFFADANQSGSGKGLLLKVIGWLMLGKEIEVVSQTDDESEERKRITSKLLGGSRLVQIDNIVRPFGSAPLDALLTTGVWAERLLGTNDSPALESHITWYASANNAGFLRDDTRRRTCMVRVSTSEERPEERTGFRIPELQLHIREHRAELFAAALTVLRGWLRAGLKARELEGWGGAWGSFDDWDRVVRGAVVYAGLEDPIGAKATVTDSEATSGGLADLVGGLEATLVALGETEVAAGRLVETLAADDADWRRPGPPSRRRHGRLREGLIALAPHLRERLPSGAQVGRVLAKVKDRPVRVGTELKRLVARVLCGERLWRVETIPPRGTQRSVAAPVTELDEREDVAPRWN